MSDTTSDDEAPFGPGFGATEEEMRACRVDWLRVAVGRAGGIVKFAGDLGISLQAVDGWKKRGHVPFDRATTIEQLYGVPREELVLPELAMAYLTPRAVAEPGTELL